jgi:hypothetical protein
MKLSNGRSERPRGTGERVLARPGRAQAVAHDGLRYVACVGYGNGNGAGDRSPGSEKRREHDGDADRDARQSGCISKLPGTARTIHERQCYHRTPTLPKGVAAVMEHRRYQRTPIDLPLEFTHSESKERTPGRATDLAVGGMFVRTSNPATFGAEIVLFVMFPGERRTLELPAVVRWTRPGQGMGLQFGLLGARETHAIMEACHSAKANTPTS